MKRIIGISLFLFFGFSSAALAQSKVDKAGHAVKTGAKKVGHKTAEVASKGKSKVVDKTYKDKVGPGGETIYIDKHDKYYYVDKKGHKKYVTDAELRNKG
ncbi:MAG TPA: hypothetical protein VNR87_03205 [Flavisolibacter sp.]|nr:hypothetical protein [Flavisolibacter sp.]